MNFTNYKTKIYEFSDVLMKPLSVRTKVLLKVLLFSPVPLNVRRPDLRSMVKRP